MTLLTYRIPSLRIGKRQLAACATHFSSSLNDKDHGPPEETVGGVVLTCWRHLSLVSWSWIAHAADFLFRHNLDRSMSSVKIVIISTTGRMFMYTINDQLKNYAVGSLEQISFRKKIIKIEHHVVSSISSFPRSSGTCSDQPIIKCIPRHCSSSNQISATQ